LLSYSLRLSSTVEPRERMREIVRQLEGIGGRRPTGFGANRVRSLPDGVSQALREYLEETLDEYVWEEVGRESNRAPKEQLDFDQMPSQHRGDKRSEIGDLCPDCGQAALVNEEGCRKCYACGYSEC
jgi:ribonucleoside-diphosphate reductase alpha chain